MFFRDRDVSLSGRSTQRRPHWKVQGAAAVVGWVFAVSANGQNNVPAPAPVASAPAAVTSVRVHGTITDPDTELIPGATITFTPTGGKPVTIKSGPDGTYSLSVAPGKYTVLVTMPGFASYTSTNVPIPAVVSTTLDATLQIGTQTQVITVEANAVQLSVDPRRQCERHRAYGQRPGCVVGRSRRASRAN